MAKYIFIPLLCLQLLSLFTSTIAVPAKLSTRDESLLYSLDKRADTRTWRVTGPAATGFAKNAAAGTRINAIMKAFMQANSVSQAQLSISKNGAPLLNRAYTWANSSRSTTQVTDTFLLASISKMFCAAAVQSLLNNGKLAPGTKVYPKLGYTKPKDPRALDITVQHLLDHYGGYDSAVSGDPVFDMRNIAIAMSGGRRPASMRDMVEYQIQRPLDVAPGTAYHYSNYGYMLLSYLVANVTKMPYYTYLSKTILQPEGLQVKKWLTDPSYHVNDPVKQESIYTGLSALHPLSNAIVPAVYGGDGIYKDSMMGPSALAASAATLTKVAAKHPVWGNGNGRASGSGREGSMPGARTRVESMVNGLDWSVVVNTRDFKDGNPDTEFEKMVSAVLAFLNRVQVVV